MTRKDVNEANKAENARGQVRNVQYVELKNPRFREDGDAGEDAVGEDQKNEGAD